MEAKIRVKELRFVKASELQGNPKNWRRHPKEQQAAMTGALRDIGYTNALVAREVDGKLELIDGHLRQTLTPNQIVPVLVVDLDAEEARKALVTMDPISALAQTDEDQLQSLLYGMDSHYQEMRDFLDLLRSTKVEITDAESETQDEDMRHKVQCPSCGFKF